MAILISFLSSEKVTLSADSLQQLLLQQQVRNIKSLYLQVCSTCMNTFLTWFVLDWPVLKMMQSQLLGLGGVADAGVLQRIKEKEQQPGDFQALQARIIQLEGQVC